MKLAQLTINVYDNYGNILQKYALHKTLQKFSDSAEVLWHHTEHETFPDNADIPFFTDRNIFADSVKNYKCKNFERKNIKTRFDLPYLEEVADDYDFFVVGSDQVWNPAFVSPEFFLNFVPPEKKIAYAASIAVEKLPENLREIYRQNILSFPSISVREKKSAEIVFELTGKMPKLLLDPVFLLTAEDWLKIAERPSWLDKKYSRGYILTYFWTYSHKFYLEAVKNLTAELNLPIINLLDLNNFDHYCVGPEEFLYLVANATAIFTHSFHGTAFSILFRRPVCAFEEPGNLNFSRIQNLLELFNLEDRKISLTKSFQPKNLLSIDYGTRDKILPVERAKAFNFLTEAIQGGGIRFYKVKIFCGEIFLWKNFLMISFKSFPDFLWCCNLNRFKFKLRNKKFCKG